MWTEFFSKIVLINLPERKDRFLRSMGEFAVYNMYPEIVDGIKRENGQDGVRDTLIKLFTSLLKDPAIKNVLVFEDDVKIITHSPFGFNGIMEWVVDQMPKYWHMLYLGANLPDPKLVTECRANLFKTKRALALHAVAYSRECMEMVLSLPKQLAIDLEIANFINPLGHSYVTFPLLCTQHPGYSDIEKKQTDYSNFIEDRYLKVVLKLLSNHEQKSSKSNQEKGG